MASGTALRGTDRALLSRPFRIAQVIRRRLLWLLATGQRVRKLRTVGLGVILLVSLVAGLVLRPGGGANPALALVAGTYQTKAALAIEGGAASVIGNRLYVSHGYRPGDSAALSIYDIATDTWWTAASASVARSELVGAAAGGKHYAIGGRSSGVLRAVEVYDPATATWTRGPDMPTARAGLGAAAIGDKIYVVGGRTGTSPHSGSPLATNEVLDTTTMTWSTRQPMPQPMMDVYATAAIGGRVYVFGGYSAGVKSTVQIYDPTTNAWTLGTAPMPTARSNAAVGVIGGRAFVIGGVNNSMDNLKVNEVYDPATNLWDTATPKPVPGSEFAVGAISSPSHIFLVGSGIIGTAMSIHEVFSPTSPPVTSNPPRLRVDKYIVEPDPPTIFLSGTGVPSKARVRLIVTGIGDPVRVTTNLDIVFALDSSGSMSWNDPSGLRRSGAKSFVDKLDPAKDMVGVVSWDENIDFSQPLTSDFTLAKSKIDAVDDSGGTDLNAGLNEAIRLLDTGGRPGATKVIVFLSNGEGSYSHSTAETARNKGYVVYTIGLNQPPGSGGEANLRDMANTTGGRYYSAPTAANLQAIYDAIGVELSISLAGTAIVVTEVLQSYIQYEGSPSQSPALLPTRNADGTTTIVWNAGFLRIGDVWEVTFLISSNRAGDPVETQVTGPGGARVVYDDYLRNPTTLLAPQVKMVVIENQAPVCSAGPDQVVLATHRGPLYTVNLDGRNSRDPDNLPNPLSYRWVWVSGSATGPNPTVQLPLGQTRLTLAVYDGAATSQCSVLLTVQDSVPPTVMAQPDVVVEQQRREGTPLTLTATITDAVDPNPRLEWKIGGNTITFPHVFPRGSTTISAVGTDASGNSASDDVMVTVRDTIAPVISVADVQVPQDPNNPIGARVLLTAGVYDTGDGSPAVSWSIGPEADFPVGTTPVTVTARDSSGNTSSASLRVTVLATVARTLHVREWQRPFSGLVVRGPSGVILDPTLFPFPDPIASTPSVIKDGGLYKMWYSVLGGSGKLEVRHATSPNGVNWEVKGTVLTGTAGSWDSDSVGSPFVYLDEGVFRMWYTGVGRDMRPAIGYATSTDGINWAKHPRNPVLTGDLGTFEDTGVLHPSVLWDATPALWKMWYTGRAETSGQGVGTLKIGYATSLDGIMWTKHATTPVLEAGPQGSWDSRGVGIATVLRGSTGQFVMYYTGYSGVGGSLIAKIGSATSSNGTSWENRRLRWDVGPTGSWDGRSVGAPFLLLDGEKALMWYSGVDASLNVGIGLAINYTTIRAALAEASPAGDTILVHPGTDKYQLVVDKQVVIRTTDGPTQTTIDADRQTTTSAGGGYPVVWIKADNVTLQGFTVKNAAPTNGYVPGSGPSPGAGVMVLAHGARLRGNVVRDNQVGLVFVGPDGSSPSQGSVIAANTIEDNTLFGIIAHLKDSTIGGASQAADGNTIARSGYGIFLVATSSGNTVARNTIKDNTGAPSLGGGAGVLLALSGGVSGKNTIVENDFGGNGIAVALNNASDNTVESNQVAGSLLQGIYIGSQSTGNTVRNNRVTQSKLEGIFIRGPRNTFDGNTVSEGLDIGIRLTDGAAGNELLRNRVTLNQKTGMELDNADGNKVHDNPDISGNKWHGIALGQFGVNNVLERNAVTGNTKLGIWVEGNNNTVRGSRIADNREAGIGLGATANNNRLEGNLLESTGSSNGVRYQPIGLRLEGSNNQVEKNVITSHGLGVILGAEATGNGIRFNDIVGNSEGGITKAGGTSVDAIYNWYGDASGPGGAGAGKGDAVSGAVNYSPWLTKIYGDVLSAQNGYLGFDIGLPKGWQGLATPFHLKDSTWGQVTRRGALMSNSLALNYDIAYRFNSATQAWEQMLDADPVVPLQGYMVLMKESDRVVLWVNDGAPTSPPSRKVKGWALTGPAEPPWLSTRAAGEMLATAWVMGLRVVSPPLSGQPAWVFTVFNPNPENNDPSKTAPFSHGRVLWVYAPDELTITGTTTTPISDLSLPRYLLP